MTCSEKCQDLKHDLTSSWYFRLWLLLFIVCACVSIGAMSIYAKRAKETTEEHGMRTYVERANSIPWPGFRLHVDWDDPQTFVQPPRCVYVDRPVQVLDPPTACPSWMQQDMTKCLLYTPNRNAVHPRDRDGFGFFGRAIHCSIVTTSTSQPGTFDDTLAFEIQDGLEGPGQRPQGFSGGDNGFASMWMTPRNNIWVLISKDVIDLPDRTMNDWHRALVYHSSVATPTPEGYNVYNLTIAMDKFIVLHYQEGDWFDGWMSGGAVGGFICLLYLVMSTVMALAGICLNNDSLLLGNAKAYQPQDGTAHNTAASAPSESYGGL